MKIHYSKDFQRNFNKRIPRNSNLEKRYRERLDLFLKDKSNPILKDHKLIGKLKNYRSFSITGDVRAVYVQESQTEVLFVDIGTHNQVYK